MRRRVLPVAAAVVAALIWLITTLPPRAITLDPAGWAASARPTVRGAFHVHTSRSDGAGSIDDVASAAARAGLDFVLFSDHGDATRPLQPPAYRAGVLCIDGIEISTTGGHYLAFDLSPAPYPLGGEPRDVVEDVARLGGFGAVAHPDSPKPMLRWADWTVPFDGLEWLNADSEWRNEPVRRLVRAPFDYLVRGPETLAGMLGRPAGALARWDALTARRRIVALAGADAHARLGLRGSDPYDDSTALLRLPSYESSFRTFSIHVELDAPLTGEPAWDGRMLLAALREGRVYSVLDAFAAPGRLEFEASATGGRARMGEAFAPGAPVTFRVRALAPEDARLVLLRNGEVAAESLAPELVHQAPADPAVFRVEVRLARARNTASAPWILSNPIYVRRADAEGEAPPPRLPPMASELLLGDGSTSGWHIESSPGASGAIDALERNERELVFRFALPAGRPAGQFAALAFGLAERADGLAGFDRLSFRGRADRPRRVSIQVRLPGEPEQPRWQRSVYLDPEPRDLSVFFEDLTAIGATPTRRPDLARARTVLIVVDTTHTAPGSSGTLRLEGIRLERSR